jgi:hypothetical protein
MTKVLDIKHFALKILTGISIFVSGLLPLKAKGASGPRDPPAGQPVPVAHRVERDEHVRIESLEAVSD